MLFRAFFLGVMISCALSMRAPFSTLSVRLSTSAGQKGSVRLAVFDSEKSFEDESPTMGKVLKFQPTGLPLEHTFSELPAGSFVIAAYHDLNNDGKLNRNLFGVPVEPYAFSGKPDSKWRAPKWEEIAITTKGLDELHIELKYWKDH